MSITVVLLIAAFICFILDTVGVNNTRVSLTPLGLAFWVLSILIHGLS